MRVALVTGAAGGIGRAVVDALVADGLAVIAADIRQGEPPPEGATPLDLDVADAAAVQRAVDDAGPIDVLVNAAGIYGDLARTDRIDPALWNRYLRTNASGPFYLTRAVLPHMRDQRWGRIVNVASIASTDGGYKQAHYASSKAALIGLTRSVALEFAAAGITCNAVLPGPIATPKLLETPDEVIDGMLEWVPAARLGESEEVAAVIAFLCRDEAAYVNGTSIPVDGASMLLQFKFARPSKPRPT
jgi:NAD(P)-dependent dehydrogenase (short-subunit alcohol dehydrogenase family)